MKTFIIAAVSIGAYLIPSISSAEWLPKHSKKAQVLVDYANTIKAPVYGIEGSTSGTDFHIWIMNSNKGCTYTLGQVSSATTYDNTITALLEAKDVVVLGWDSTKPTKLQYMKLNNKKPACMRN